MTEIHYYGPGPIDVHEIAASFGHEVVWEHRTVTPPPTFCEPTEPDLEWHWPGGVRPDVDEPRVCRVHDEWWPCTALREGRPVTFHEPREESVLALRPKVGQP